jgi:enterobactin synthetase component D
MPFYNFNYIDHRKSDSSSFITETIVWSHQILPITLVMCRYKLSNFSPELYTRYRIDIPDEILKSVIKRQADFLAGRIAANRALRASGLSLDATIKILKHRAPHWPTGVSGSISHSSTIATAVVGNVEVVKSLGIDIEDNLAEEVCTQVAEQIHDAAEAKILTALGFTSRRATTVIFSAKEAIFKALYKYVNEYFGFECARVVSADIHNQVLRVEIDQTFREKHNLNVAYMCHYAFIDSSILSLVHIDTLSLIDT